MLLWLWNRLQDAYAVGNRSELNVQIERGGLMGAGGGLSVLVWVPVGADEPDPNVHSRPVSISDEIPELSRGAEAVAVFDRLAREGYIAVSFGKADSAVFHDLTSKGLIDIGKFPDPDRRLAEAFEAARRVVEHDVSLTASERADRLEAIEKILSLLNSVSGLGRQALEMLSHTGGGGGG